MAFPESITIDANEGVLLNNRILIGQGGTYRFSVMAVDGGGLNSTVSVNLTVQEISRCQPVWVKPDENSTILEVQEVSMGVKVTVRLF